MITGLIKAEDVMCGVRIINSVVARNAKYGSKASQIKVR